MSFIVREACFPCPRSAVFLLGVGAFSSSNTGLDIKVPEAVSTQLREIHSLRWLAARRTPGSSGSPSRGLQTRSPQITAETIRGSSPCRTGERRRLCLATSRPGFLFVSGGRRAGFPGNFPAPVAPFPSPGPRSFKICSGLAENNAGLHVLEGRRWRLGGSPPRPPPFLQRGWGTQIRRNFRVVSSKHRTTILLQGSVARMMVMMIRKGLSGRDGILGIVDQASPGQDPAQPTFALSLEAPPPSPLPSSPQPLSGKKTRIQSGLAPG